MNAAIHKPEVSSEKFRDMDTCECGAEKPVTHSRCTRCRKSASRNRRIEEVRRKDRIRKRVVVVAIPTVVAITRTDRQLAAVVAYARTLPDDECETVLKSGGMPWVSSIGKPTVVALPESRRREKEDARLKLLAPSRGLWELACAEEMKRQAAKG